MRILITGAASFLGRHLVEYFLSKEEEVLALVRENARGRDELLKYEANNKFKLIVLDMKDIERLDTEFDVCIHLAWGGIGKEGRMDENIQRENIDAAVKLMRVCKERGAKRFLFAGSQAEYGQTLSDIEVKYGKDFDINNIPKQSEKSPTNPKSEYGKAKLELKSKLKNLGDSLGIEYVHMRIFSVFGSGDHETSLISTCIRNFKENKDVHIGECIQSWNYIYIKDLCEAVYLLSKKDLQGEFVFNVAGENNRILMDYVKDIKKLLNSTGDIVVEKKEAASEGLPFLNPNIERLKRIGFVESYGFEKGIKDCI
ncbi:NAD(P)-dependent oxidoreductase [Lachnoanaerobaculum orale]|uniref:NAD(P)-dependent oxidoreductase n=1 Tax=Lachnoanaerobaculum orale TaxID=979627 RepID=A0A3P3Q1F2_9FIRM|nr:NAD(P)-dependent oxidoreductase [Lachnoanaerobaculum orale]RRJ14279.1 NAD(P)-dependent oxidoreductase [Lachnoanaerobaculum orale]